jgi:hypothetical protein
VTLQNAEAPAAATRVTKKLVEKCILGDGRFEVVNGSWSFWEEIWMGRNLT